MPRRRSRTRVSGTSWSRCPTRRSPICRCPQRKALRVALLREEPEGPNPDPRAVAVACLNTLRSLSADGHVVIAVDDIQWLDPASAQAIAFAMRRLDGDSIRFLLARRLDDRTPPSGLDRALVNLAHERIEVGPIDPETMGRLLADSPRSSIRRPDAPQDPGELRRESAVRDRARPGDPAWHRRPRSRAGTCRSRSTLLDLVGAPIRALPDATQRALAVVAALAAPTVELVSDAIGAPAEGLLRPAVDAHLVVIEGDRIRFAHPLHAVAARSSLTPAAQREIHARLAEIVPDPEQRARHLALATLRPDESVAAALEEAAERARARGAPAAAAELAAMSRRLTPPDRTEDATRRGLRGGLGAHDGRRLRARP